VAWLGVMPTYGQEVKSTQVKLVSVQMPDSAQKGVPFKLTVSTQVTNADSTKGGITVSFSKPVEILIAPSSASAKVYPQGSKLWNQQVKANIESKQAMVELWTEYWPKERIHQLSLEVTPLEAGDLDVFIRATATDATSGESVNAPPKGVVDQQGFPCEKRTISIKATVGTIIVNVSDRLTGKPLDDVDIEVKKWFWFVTISPDGVQTLTEEHQPQVIDVKPQRIREGRSKVEVPLDKSINYFMVTVNKDGYGSISSQVKVNVNEKVETKIKVKLVKSVFSEADRIKALQASLENLPDLIKKLEDPDESIQQQAEDQLVDIIWITIVDPDYRGGYLFFEEADIFLSDIDGDGIREIIASFSMGTGMGRGGNIAVVDETLSTIQVIDVGADPTVKTTDLFGEGKLALIIESSTHLGTGLGTSDIAIYQWRQGKFTEVWEGFSEDVDDQGHLGTHFTRAKVQIVDLDQDGIREIVRIGKTDDSAWAELPLPEGVEDRELKVEIEMGSFKDADLQTRSGIDFGGGGGVELGYQVVYKFKEIFFWNKDFNHYIQYKARVTKETTVMVGSESVSIPSGTVVGVLTGDYGSGSVSVVLPDGRIGRVDKGVLEKIRSEDEQGR